MDRPTTLPMAVKLHLLDPELQVLLSPLKGKPATLRGGVGTGVPRPTLHSKDQPSMQSILVN